jgi:hypothetical protein
MGLYAVEIEGKYGQKGKTNKFCILLEEKSDREAIRQAQNIFLKKFPDDYVQEFDCIKITLDATKKNPSSRSPIEVTDDATNRN